ncbi:Fes/CIP4-like domain protein (macronuclear) [Tetrahymena thermophila SB210]|uniref:Fes/CIP4-like domain protein n=1 Tax=Tetrahymena thermophila (strain SB210) TaxID=312017 RepID=I7M1W7_TETTS|nr:Fes/CIP4-like domain protein [Tetrahymena thermophila SB210]EAR97924.2 Fes/CIP4-like domain protein [Tetrahymena thermophila SB210]|eukprot:XP_001018169.2 Fes/CIP4-like domain protein [Tetrahymena thermophila SB210]
MSFANDLWDKFEQVSRLSQENRKVFEDFIDLFQERAQAEESYSKTMEKLTIRLQNLQIGKTQGVQNIISSLKTNFMNRSEQAKALSEQIQVEILEKSRQIINEQNNTSKKLISDGRKFEKDLKTAQENLDKAKLKFLRAEREAQSCQIQDEILKLSQDISSEKRQKQAQKTKQCLSEVKELDQQYKYYLLEFNNTLDLFYEQMNRIQNSLQDYECQRINQMKDSVMKNLVFETSYIKNIEYDIDNISEKLGQVEAQKDVQEIISRNQSKRPKQEQIKYEPYISFIGKTIQSLELKYKKLNTEDVIEEYLSYKTNPQPQSEFASDQLNQELKSQCDAIYRQYQEILQDSDKEKAFFDDIEESLDSNQLGRIVWSYCFNFYRMKGTSELTSIQFKNITQIFNSLLDNCFKNKDSITAKRLILLSFSFYTTQESLDFKKLRKHSDEQIQELMDELQKSKVDLENKSQSMPANQNQNKEEEEQEEEEQKINVNEVNKNDKNMQIRKKSNNDEQIEEEKVDQNQILNANKQDSVASQLEFEMEKRNSKNIVVPDGVPENSEDLSSLSLLEAQNQKEILRIFKPEVPIKKEKIYIQYQLMNHIIIKSKDFWESCAFESVVSELQIKSRRKIEKKENFDYTKDKYIIFGQLASVSHHMLIFNFEKREIKDIIQRYSRYFSLPEDQLNDLMFTVENHVQKVPLNNINYDNQAIEQSSGNFLKDLGSFLKI